MATRLSLHDFDAEDGALLEHLAAGASDAESGGGIFGWTNRSGIDAFVGAPAVLGLLERGTFRLIVGVDTVTDVPALRRLGEIAAEHPGLQPCVLVHDNQPLFHPKVAWFRSGTRLTLIVGSGNLTNGGLRRNWEACVVSTLDGAEADAAEAQLLTWIDSVAGLLRPVDHPHAISRAEQNRGRERDLRRAGQVAQQAGGEVGALPVLIAETGGPLRWQQADVRRHHLETYFGYVDRNFDVSMSYVGLDGVDHGSRTSRVVYKPNSSNFTVEMSGLTGSYPNIVHEDDPRPIAVFRRVGEDAYRFVFVRPADPQHALVEALLAGIPRFTPSGQFRLRREQFEIDQLAAAWPGCPLL